MWLKNRFPFSADGTLSKNAPSEYAKGDTAATTGGSQSEFEAVRTLLYGKAVDHIDLPLQVLSFCLQISHLA